jgi:hypothetical protein
VTYKKQRVDTDTPTAREPARRFVLRLDIKMHGHGGLGMALCGMVMSKDAPVRRPLYILSKDRDKGRVVDSEPSSAHEQDSDVLLAIY